jgi:hypothetical protein
MKKLIALIFFVLPTLGMASDTSLSQSTSPAQELKKHFINGCVSRGLQRNDEAVEVAKFCTCTFDVMAKELTVQEYIDVDRASLEKRSLDTVPALARVTAKMAICKK